MRKTDLFKNLTKEQKKAITYHDGPLLIIAGPGSGKTYSCLNISRLVYIL